MNMRAYRHKRLRHLGLKVRIVLFAVVISLVGASCQEDDGFKNAHLLVSTSWLSSHMSDVLIVDTRTEEAYDTGHIEGAIHSHYSDYTDDLGLLKPESDLASLLGARGISSDQRVVVVGDLSSEPGADVRMFWMLEYLGHRDVRVLDGGMGKWIADGYSVTDAVSSTEAVTFTTSVQSNVIAELAEVQSHLTEPGAVVWDLRPDEEFIGWPMLGDAAGGHVKGAHQLDYRRLFKDTLDFKGAGDVTKLLEPIGIYSGIDVVVMGYDGSRSAYGYLALRLMGNENVRNFDGSMRQWMASSGTQTIALSNYQSLVSPAWARALTDGEDPPTYPGSGYVIVDASTYEEYEAGHIPGAINVEFPAFNSGAMPPTSPEDANLLPPNALKAAIESNGISEDTTVVVYGATPPNTARIVWALMYAGVSDVRILNGGLAAWTARGYATETVTTTPSPTTYGGLVPGRPELLATTSEIESHFEDSDYALVDIRTHDEYIGIDDHAYITNPGHIPGAIFQDWALWIEEDATFINFDLIEAEWESLGITSNKSVRFS